MEKPQLNTIDKIEETKDFFDPNKKECFILSLDGGGIRGIISTTVLKNIEQELKTNEEYKGIRDSFDIIAGTSTGGLIATALSCKSYINEDEVEPSFANIDEVIDIYKNYGRIIFSDSGPSFLNAVSDRYSERPLETLLNQWFGDIKFGQCTLPTIIVGYNATQGLAYPMTSTENPSLLCRNVGRATSAAPTYFTPFKQDNEFIIDGGVVANNPSLYAYEYAKKIYPNCEKFHILSIGTCAKPYRFTKKNSYGLVSWVGVHKVYATAQMETTDRILNTISDVDYLRVSDELTDGIAMDDPRLESLIKLELAGNDVFKKHRVQILEFYDKIFESKRPKVEPEVIVEPQLPEEKPKLKFTQRLKMAFDILRNKT